MNPRWKGLLPLLFVLVIDSTYASYPEESEDLLCHVCNSIDNGNDCLEMFENSTAFMKTCGRDELFCMIKRYAHTSLSANGTLQPMQAWSVERNCSRKCENQCLIMGDRFKLQTCTTCCTDSLCNYGRGTAARTIISTTISWLVAFLLLK